MLSMKPKIAHSASFEGNKKTGLRAGKPVSL
jgi:hypothetical protein